MCLGLLVILVLFLSLVAGLREEDLINRLFISYSSKDFGWVTDNLISILEKHSIDYSIHSRDFEIGIPIVQNMADSVYGSRQVWVLQKLSNFSRPDWLIFYHQ